MVRTRLNLTALRNRFHPSGERSSAGGGDLGISERDMLSRRQLIKRAGIAAVGLAPAARSVGPSLMGQLEMVGDRGHVAFRLGGRERWRIDTRFFAGSPELTVTREREVIRISLRDARFPGTNLPADLECEIVRGMFGCRMNLRAALGGFACEVPFERWLLGMAEARSRVDLDAEACAFGAGGSLRLAGRARALYTTDWTYRLTGAGIAGIDGLGGVIPSDAVTLRLPAQDEPSLARQSQGRRTLIELDRGTRKWNLVPEIKAGLGWESAGADSFDAVTIEAEETRRGARRHLFLAEARDETPRFRFRPGGGVDRDGGPFAIPLVGMRYAAAFGDGEEHAAVSARFGDPVWMHGDGYSLEVGGPGGVFETSAFNGRVERTDCEPSLRRINVPLAGALTDPVDLPEGSRLRFMPDTSYIGTQKPLDKKIDPNIGKPPNNSFNTQPPSNQPAPTSAVPFPENFTVSVVRPRDLLVLRFEFVNMRLKTGSAGAHLARIAANQPAVMVVHFQPQNIAEQAFYETAAGAENYSQPVGAGKPGYEKNFNNTDNPTAPPVKARIAGRSRLAFRLPSGMDQIPYTLNDLLDWSKLEPNLAPVALPPPPPPVKAYIKPKGDIGSKVKVGTGISEKEVSYAGGVKASKSPGVTEVTAKMTSEVVIDQSAQQNALTELNRSTARSAVGSERMQTIAGIAAQKMKDDLTVYTPGFTYLVDLFTIREPLLTETSLETPYRLVISPNRFGAWAHSQTPVTLPTVNPTTNGTTERTELWHTRLGVRRSGTLKPGVSPVDENSEYYRTIRAVWSPDYNRAAPPLHYDSTKPPYPGNPFRMSLDALDRHELVTLTSDFTIEDAEERIVRVDRLMLSSLGAWMNVRGGWDIPKKYPSGVQPLSVEEWRHRATMGRDHYVRVVYKGYLFPFGHRASLIKVTERKFHKTGSYMTAYLRQRMFIVVRQPTKEYPAYGQPNDARDFCFRTVRITTLVTPNLDKPEGDAIAGKGQSAFWPHVNGPDFLFHLIATDWEGNNVEFSSPLLFIDNTVAHNTPVVNAAVADYAAKTARSVREMSGQKIAYAQPKKAGDTALPTEKITFTAVVPPDSGTTSTANMLVQDQPRFYPQLKQADVVMEAVKQVAGLAGAVPIKYPASYITHGFQGAAGDANGNSGQVFAELANGAVGMMFGGGGAGTDKVGGLATPNMNISGLSRLTGPVSGDLAKMTQGVFDVLDFFQGLDVELLGGISLFDIIKAVTGFDLSISNLKEKLEEELAGAAQQVTGAMLESLPKSPVPAFVTQMIYEAGEAVEGVQDALAKIPKELQLTFKWDPEVKTFGPFLVKGDPKDTFSMTAILLMPLTGKGPTFAVNAWLKNFAIDLFEIITVTFDEVRFKLDGGSKASVDPKIKAVEFGGPLGFVNELKDLLSFGDMFKIDIQPSGVTLDVSIGLPDVAVGAFSLMNINLGASLTIPFTGDPVRFRFHFCERESPFLLTVYIFGGGGFFAIELGMDGVELLEAALEFGVAASMSIGVASGSISVMAGIYFKLEMKPTGDQATLTGYVRLNGSVSVLGLITISVEFYLGLTWESGPPDKVWGEARMTLEIEILFFSISVTLTVRKEFVDPPPPKLPDVVSPDQWLEYRKAFAV